MARSDRAFRALGAVFGVIAALAGCNDLLALDEFSKGPCSGGGTACVDGGVVPIDAAPEAEAAPPRGTDPVSWARWPMPNYDAGDLPHPLQYSSVTADFLRDDVTGLVWRRASLPLDYKAEAALAACAALPDGPWRLPKRIELVTLLDFAKTAPPFIAEVFSVPTFPFWTSSAVRPLGPDGVPEKYWTVNFGTGRVEQQFAAFDAKVLCVRAR